MIQSVELQGVIQRSNDVTQIKAYEDGKPQQQQSNIVMNQEKAVIENHETVVKQDDTEDKKDNTEKKGDGFDAKEKTRGTYYKIKKKKKVREPEEDGRIVKKDPANFDVKI